MIDSDTIFALSSGQGKSGIAIIRISGIDLEKNFEKIVRLTGDIRPRHAYLTNLFDDNGEMVDQCIAIYYQAPNSFTGEDIIEIHSHGAPAVIEKIFEMLRGRGMRMAEPGEFSKRAFYNNKMDLTEIDGLIALLDARTDRQRSFALRSMIGSDSHIYDSWRSKMVEIAAYAAAMLDYYSDDLPGDIGRKVCERTRKLHDEIASALSRYSAARAVRNGFNIVLVGETNVGKSSLFNALVGSNRAIVSDTPGTTRDVVSADLDIDGYFVHISDTAGLRESSDSIEKIGIAKTHEEIKNADLILRVYAKNDTGFDNIPNNEIIVINKSDLTGYRSEQVGVISVSALTGSGIDELMCMIKNKIHECVDGLESDLIVNERTLGLLKDTVKELSAAMNAPDENYDIFAEHVRAASVSIGKILGIIEINEIADATFSNLCLGK